MGFCLSGAERDFSNIFSFGPDEFFPVVFEDLEGIWFCLVIVGHNKCSIMSFLINYKIEKKKEIGIENVYNNNK